MDSADLDRYAYSLSEDGSGERREDGEFRLMVGIVFAEPLDVDFSLNLIAGVFGDSSPNAPGL